MVSSSSSSDKKSQQSARQLGDSPPPPLPPLELGSHACHAHTLEEEEGEGGRRHLLVCDTCVLVCLVTL